MSVDLISASIIIFAFSGVAGLFLHPLSPWIRRINTIFVLSGVVLGFCGALTGIFYPDNALYIFPWPSVQGALIGVDALSAFFLLPVFLVGGLGAVYGLGYWPPKEYVRTAARLRFFWGLILSGMTLLVISKHAMSFLFGWETMAISAFFLVSTEDEKPDCRKSALIYLIATHVGTLTLFGFFSLWYSVTGSFNLLPAPLGMISAKTVNILFLLAFTGFGLKAGIMPLHFWLPGAHANAPSHVSALFSGVMLKMGIYGILRVLTLLPGISAFWGWFILLMGALSGLLGVIFALAQHDLKRLLAYHSVENIGIILLGMGMALLGRSYHRQEWVLLGMAGCLLHVWNHSLFKSLLFFGAGSVLHGTGTRQIDSLGGLAKVMPWTAGTFLIGAASISGLPPLNGFISEFFIYFGFFRSAVSVEKLASLALLAIPVLAMIGALAVSCFVKVSGAVFSGSPRTGIAEKTVESPLSMIIPMVILALICVTIGIFPALTAPFLERAIVVWQGFDKLAVPVALISLSGLVPFGWISLIMIITSSLVLITFIIAYFYKRKMIHRTGTWDCGYAGPTVRMQYTAASFARSLVSLFSWILKPHEHSPLLKDNFPGRSCLESHVNDPVLDRILIPDFNFLRNRARWFYRFQQGQTQAYILYLAVAMGVFLATLIPFKKLFFDLFSKQKRISRFCYSMC